MRCPSGRSEVDHLQWCLGQRAHRRQAAASSASAVATPGGRNLSSPQGHAVVQLLVERPWDRQAKGRAKQPAVAHFGAPLPTHCNACECTAGRTFAKKGLSSRCTFGARRNMSFDDLVVS